jgi:hypothetical protein
MQTSAAMSRQFHKYRSLWIIVNAIPVKEMHASVFYPRGTYYPTAAGRGVRLVTTILLCGASRKPGAAAKPRLPRQPLGATCEFRLSAGRRSRKHCLLLQGRRAKLPRMQTFPSASVRLLIWTLAVLTFSQRFASAAPAKVHVVSLGAARKVAYTPPETAAGPDDKKPDALTLKVRPLIVDGRQKEWTTGDTHDVTDRSFTVRRVLRLNDSLPGDAVARWNWQPGPWLLVDRTTGHVTALHLPDFDTEVSNAIWFRDYAAYCGTAVTIKGGLFAIVAQLGARRAVVQKQIGKWPQTAPPQPVCKTAEWQRAPMRVTLQATGGDAMTFDVVGAVSLIEEGDTADTP